MIFTSKASSNSLGSIYSRATKIRHQYFADCGFSETHLSSRRKMAHSPVLALEQKLDWKDQAIMRTYLLIWATLL